MLLRAVEQLQPAVEAHGDPEGMLVRRRDEDQPGTRMALPCVFEIKPRACRPERASRPAQSRPMASRTAMWPGSSHQTTEPLLISVRAISTNACWAAGCDYYLVLVAPDAPVVTHMQPDGPLQFWQPAGRAVAEQGVIPASHNPGMGCGPCLAGKHVKRRNPGTEGRHAAKPGGRLGCRRWRAPCFDGCTR